MKTTEIKKRLEYLRQELREERISYGELSELESLREHIDKDDTELLEAAGVPENDEDFDIILSKNRIAREIKELRRLLKMDVPEWILFDFDEIEKKTGEGNQPTGREILTSKMDV